MKQLTFFGDTPREKIVNVASVPQRSPFRYPGGKTWLIPQIRNWLRYQNAKPNEFYEPFAGGGIVSLTVAFEEMASRVTMVELDDEVAAVWKTILGHDAIWLAEKIEKYDLTDENVKAELKKTHDSVREKAFITILKNRVYHGGILAPGSGLIKNGENGKGIKSRWYPQTIGKRIRAISTINDKISFIEGDGISFIRANKEQRQVCFFIDPPYTAGGKNAGSRLYKHYDLNHRGLFEIVSSIKGNFLMTYNNTNEVLELAEQYGFDTKPIPMKNTHHAKMTELLISRDLTWVN